MNKETKAELQEIVDDQFRVIIELKNELDLLVKNITVTPKPIKKIVTTKKITSTCIGKNIRTLRKSKELTIAELSFFSGVPKTTIFDLEHTTQDPSVWNVNALAKALDTTVDALIEETFTW